MSFRFWFLYFGKFITAVCAFTFLLFGGFLPNSPLTELLLNGCLTFLMTMGVIGAVMGFMWVLDRLRFACPICGTSSSFIDCGKFQPGVFCPHCGLVYCKNYITSMQIIVEPHDDDLED